MFSTELTMELKDIFVRDLFDKNITTLRDYVEYITKGTIPTINHKTINMKTITINEIKLEVPESEVDELLKKYGKKESLDDYLYLERSTIFYFINSNGVLGTSNPVSRILYLNESTSKEQLESILELNKLANLARKLNEGWVPNWNDTYDKYYIVNYKDILRISNSITCYSTSVFFKSEELARKAIDLMGEESIKKALTLNY